MEYIINLLLKSIGYFANILLIDYGLEKTKYILMKQYGTCIMSQHVHVSTCIMSQHVHVSTFSYPPRLQ